MPKTHVVTFEHSRFEVRVGVVVWYVVIPLQVAYAVQTRFVVAVGPVISKDDPVLQVVIRLQTRFEVTVGALD